MKSQSSTFITHLEALRICIIRCGVFYFITFGICLYFKNILFEWLASPLLLNIAQHSQLIATNILSPILTPIMFCFYLSFLITIPILFTHLWYFIKPGLTQQEKKIIRWLGLPALLLFYCGITIAYTIFFPIAFYFISHSTPQYVMFMPDIQSFLNFSIQCLVAMGVAFEMPIIIFLLVYLKIYEYETLSNNRPVIFVMILTIAMLITPPDVISQILIAVPMYLLYEFGLLLTKICHVKHTKS